MDAHYGPETEDGPFFSRRQIGIIAGGGTFLLAGAAGTLAWARADTGTRGRPTSFGTVEIRRAERRPRLAAAGATGLGGSHHHGAGDPPEPGNHTWADVVLVELEVRNLQEVPVLLSPGQLRLYVGPEQISVTPNAAGRPAGAMEAGATERFAISFLTPSGTRELSAGFSDPWKHRTVLLELPAVHDRPALAARL